MQLNFGSARSAYGIDIARRKEHAVLELARQHALQVQQERTNWFLRSDASTLQPTDWERLQAVGST